jgi:ribosomal protein S18 acetylase RimI-like enzyme
METKESEADPAAQVTMREMTRQDIAAGLRLCRIARCNQTENDWSLFLELSPEGCRVAEKSGRVIGTVTTLPYQDRFSWLSMILVDPQERRAGIGTKLLQGGLQLLDGMACIRLDATPAGRELYRKHGFTDEYTLSRMTISSSPAKKPAISGRVRRMRQQDLAAVYNRDREVFGADRRVILDELFQRAPEFAWIAGEERMQGYCFSRPGPLYRQLGPIVADGAEIAASLVTQCLLQTTEPVVIDAPQQPEWLQWLNAMGFAEERRFIRMYLGENRYPGVPTATYGIVGPEFG